MDFAPENLLEYNGVAHVFVSDWEAVNGFSSDVKTSWNGVGTPTVQIIGLLEVNDHMTDERFDEDPRKGGGVPLEASSGQSQRWSSRLSPCRTYDNTYSPDESSQFEKSKKYLVMMQGARKTAGSPPTIKAADDPTAESPERRDVLECLTSRILV
jgi:hypothetical protein